MSEEMTRIEESLAAALTSQPIDVSMFSVDVIDQTAVAAPGFVTGMATSLVETLEPFGRFWSPLTIGGWSSSMDSGGRFSSWTTTPASTRTSASTPSSTSLLMFSNEMVRHDDSATGREPAPGTFKPPLFVPHYLMAQECRCRYGLVVTFFARPLNQTFVCLFRMGPPLLFVWEAHLTTGNGAQYRKEVVFVEHVLLMRPFRRVDFVAVRLVALQAGHPNVGATWPGVVG